MTITGFDELGGCWKVVVEVLLNIFAGVSMITLLTNCSV